MHYESQYLTIFASHFQVPWALGPGSFIKWRKITESLNLMSQELNLMFLINFAYYFLLEHWITKLG